MCFVLSENRSADWLSGGSVFQKDYPSADLRWEPPATSLRPPDRNRLEKEKDKFRGFFDGPVVGEGAFGSAATGVCSSVTGCARVESYCGFAMGDNSFESLVEDGGFPGRPKSTLAEKSDSVSQCEEVTSSRNSLFVIFLKPTDPGCLGGRGAPFPHAGYLRPTRTNCQTRLNNFRIFGLICDFHTGKKFIYWAQIQELKYVHAVQ